MLAVLGVEEAAKRLDPAHDHEQIVATEREHGIDEIVPRALVAQMHLEPVGEEGKEIQVSRVELFSRHGDRLGPLDSRSCRRLDPSVALVLC